MSSFSRLSIITKALSINLKAISGRPADPALRHSMQCGVFTPRSRAAALTDSLVRMPSYTKTLYVRSSFTDGDKFDLKLAGEADAKSVYTRTLRDWEAGRDVNIRRLDSEHHRGGWVNADIAGISLLSEDEILASG